MDAAPRKLRPLNALHDPVLTRPPEPKAKKRKTEQPEVVDDEEEPEQDEEEEEEEEEAEADDGDEDDVEEAVSSITLTASRSLSLTFILRLTRRPSLEAQPRPPKLTRPMMCPRRPDSRRWMRSKRRSDAFSETRILHVAAPAHPKAMK